tara:strand:+ start:659 stop:1906 length:1248 start_codon:yes stop_codon:yes gene_type:complete
MAIPLTLGALSRISSGFTDQPVEETEDTLTTIPIYGIGTQQPDVNLQEVYGTSAMPMFEFARKIQTGELTFDPSRQFDKEAAEYFSQIPEDQIPEDLQVTVADIVGPLASGAVGMLAGEAGRLASQASGVASGNLLGSQNLDFWDQTGTAAKNLLGMGDIKSKLNVGEVAISAADQATMMMSPDPGTRHIGASAKRLSNDAFSLPHEQLKAAQGGLAENITATDVAGPGFFETGFKGYMPSAMQIGVPFFADLGIGLLSGQKPKKALKSAGFSALGATVGTVFGGPIGGFIGGTLGKIFGGRVVCNELHRQGYLSREKVIDDYKFTRDYLTPQHVRGYHVWAIPVVNQMRKGRMVGFWRHLCVHRANEIAYIYGKRDKPDYLGKIYRRLLEWPSWTIGFFCKASDWSILYKHKEI